jgi:hypothetical protein
MCRSPVEWWGIYGEATYVADLYKILVQKFVETMGIEPTTSGLQSPRSTN